LGPKVRGFTLTGDIILQNRWIVSKDFGHIKHAYALASAEAETLSFDRVYLPLTSGSFPALTTSRSTAPSHARPGRCWSQRIALTTCAQAQRTADIKRTKLKSFWIIECSRDSRSFS